MLLKILFYTYNIQWNTLECKSFNGQHLQTNHLTVNKNANPSSPASNENSVLCAVFVYDGYEEAIR